MSSTGTICRVLAAPGLTAAAVAAADGARRDGVVVVADGALLGYYCNDPTCASGFIGVV